MARGIVVEEFNAIDFFRWMKENKRKDFARLFRQYAKYCLDKTLGNLEEG